MTAAHPALRRGLDRLDFDTRAAHRRGIRGIVGVARHVLVVKADHAHTLAEVLINLGLGANRARAPEWIEEGPEAVVEFDAHRAWCFGIVEAWQIGIVPVHTDDRDPRAVSCVAIGQRGANRRRVVHKGTLCCTCREREEQSSVHA